MRREPHIWLVGNGGFYNRGCEAIFRSTLDLLHDEFGECRFSVWSPDYIYDKAQIAEHFVGVRPNSSSWFSYPGRFCPVPLRPKKVLRHARFVLPSLLSSRKLRRLALRLSGMPDCVLSLGGDNFSLDYGTGERFVNECEYFMRYGVPTVIWSASVGPFSADPEREKRMANSLRKVDLITVRESATIDYLSTIGVSENVVRVHDVAFALKSIPYTGPEADFLASGNVVGLNVSALILKWYSLGDTADLVSKIAQFIESLVEQGLKVLLVPHVTVAGGALPMNDFDFLHSIRDKVEASDESVALFPGHVSAQKVKWVISQCRFFIGSRTHATIAAVSSGVPTIAIAYSAKARGIWQDIFGHTDYLLETDKLCSDALMQKVQLLIKDEESIRKILDGKHQEMLDGARQNAVALADLLRRRSCL